MKVLLVHKENANTNLFVSSLKNALCAAGVETVCSLEDYWNNYQAYDIIHIQWINSLLFRIKTQSAYRNFIEHFDKIKTQCKIVVTCHNVKPHRKLDEYQTRLHEYVYSHCDAMIHLGQFSYDYFKGKLPSTIEHTIIPHHIYNNDFTFSIDKLAARKQLHIPEKSCVILCFGEFRNSKERKLVLQAYKNIDIPNKRLFAPGFFRPEGIVWRKNLFIPFKEIVKFLYYKLLAFCNGIKFSSDLVAQNEVEVYFCATDIVMIQRCQILNSGNLFMGFHAGKVVVGPDIGNVGLLLKERENPVFNPDDNLSVADAIREGVRLSKTDLGDNNREFAEKNQKVEKVAQEHLEFYKQLLKHPKIDNNNLI